VNTVVTVARAFAITSSVAILQVVCCVSVTSLLTLASIVAKNCNVSQINSYLLMHRRKCVWLCQRYIIYGRSLYV